MIRGLEVTFLFLSQTRMNENSFHDREKVVERIGSIGRIGKDGSIGRIGGSGELVALGEFAVWVKRGLEELVAKIV